MKKMSLVFLVLGVSFAESAEIGGELRLRNDLLFPDDPETRDNEELRLKIRRDMDRASIDAQLVFSTGWQPLDPRSGFRKKSLVLGILDELFTAFLPAGRADSLQQRTDSLPPSTLELLLGDPRAQLQLEENVERLYASSYFPRDKLLVDRLQIKFFFSKVDMTLGRQVLGWGTGYAWNPTDLWNSKSPLNPTAPKISSDGLRFLWSLGELSTLDFVVFPGTKPSLASGGVRLRSNLIGTDWSLSLARFAGQDRELFGIPRRLQLGFDLAGQLPGEIGFWFEGAGFHRYRRSSEMLDFDSLNAQGDAGLQYTLDEGTTLSLEYYYNGLGKWNWQDYSAQDFISLFAGEMAGLAKQYLMLGANRDFFDYWNFTFYSMFNSVDYSAALIPVLSWQFLDDVKLELGAQIFVGEEKKSELASNRNTVYLQGSAWF